MTLTAPGADVLGWDLSQCTHRAGIACSGKLGCRVDEIALALWHATVGQRWSWFVEYVRRSLPGVDVQFFKTWEPQQRGAMHAHAMVRLNGICTDRRARAAFRLSARRWDFGRQLKVDSVDVTDPRAIARTAGYCAKYASKSADEMVNLRKLDTATGELARCGLRAWSASKRWGDTMGNIRLAQRQWAASAPAGAEPSTAVGGLDLQQDFYTEIDADLRSLLISLGHLTV